jgi:hypothetical protein
MSEGRPQRKAIHENEFQSPLSTHMFAQRFRSEIEEAKSFGTIQQPTNNWTTTATLTGVNHPATGSSEVSNGRRSQGIQILVLTVLSIELRMVITTTWYYIWGILKCP